MFIPGEAGLPLEGPCPSCTSIIDAVDGEAPHIVQRINLAAVAKAPLEQFREHARTRGWRNVRLLSSANTTYNADYQGESERGQNPIATIFVRRDGKIHHFWSSELFFAPTEPGMHPRHVDFIWPLWAVLDLTPEGRGTDWGPELAYSNAAALASIVVLAAAGPRGRRQPGSRAISLLEQGAEARPSDSPRRAWQQATTASTSTVTVAGSCRCESRSAGASSLTARTAAACAIRAPSSKAHSR